MTGGTLEAVGALLVTVFLVLVLVLLVLFPISGDSLFSFSFSFIGFIRSHHSSSVKPGDSLGVVLRGSALKLEAVAPVNRIVPAQKHCKICHLFSFGFHPFQLI